MKLEQLEIVGSDELVSECQNWHRSRVRSGKVPSTVVAKLVVATKYGANDLSSHLSCKVVGAGGAAAGTLATPIGSAVLGVGGCIIGGYAGYRVGAKIGNVVYDWGHASFHPIPQVAAPK